MVRRRSFHELSHGPGASIRPDHLEIRRIRERARQAGDRARLALIGQSAKERVERRSILLNGELHRLDFRLDERAMLREGLLQPLAAFADLTIGILADSPDLILAPR